MDETFYNEQVAKPLAEFTILVLKSCNLIVSLSSIGIIALVVLNIKNNSEPHKSNLRTSLKIFFPFSCVVFISNTIRAFVLAWTSPESFMWRFPFDKTLAIPSLCLLGLAIIFYCGIYFLEKRFPKTKTYLSIALGCVGSVTTLVGMWIVCFQPAMWHFLLSNSFTFIVLWLVSRFDESTNSGVSGKSNDVASGTRILNTDDIGPAFLRIKEECGTILIKLENSVNALSESQAQIIKKSDLTMKISEIKAYFSLLVALTDSSKDKRKEEESEEGKKRRGNSIKGQIRTNFNSLVEGLGDLEAKATSSKITDNQEISTLLKQFREKVDLIYKGASLCYSRTQ